MLNDFEAYMLVGKTFQSYRDRYEEFKKQNPKEDVSEDDWLIAVLITDLLVAQGKLDKSYSERI